MLSQSPLPPLAVAQIRVWSASIRGGWCRPIAGSRSPHQPLSTERVGQCCPSRPLESPGRAEAGTCRLGAMAHGRDQAATFPPSGFKVGHLLWLLQKQQELARCQRTLPGVVGRRQACQSPRQEDTAGEAGQSQGHRHPGTAGQWPALLGPERLRHKLTPTRQEGQRPSRCWPGPRQTQQLAMAGQGTR